MKGLCGFLEDDSRVTEAIHGAEVSPSQLEDSVIATRGIAKEIKLSQSAEIVAQARRLIEMVDIDADELRITVSRAGLSGLIGDANTSDGDPIVLDLPIAICRRGVESRIILQGALGPLSPDGGLIGLVSDSYQWFERIAKGEITTIRDIARQEGVDEGDVSWFLPLAFLAPDIIEAILARRQPVELTPEKLKRLRNLPKPWEEQRQLLGFPAEIRQNSPWLGVTKRQIETFCRKRPISGLETVSLQRISRNHRQKPAKISQLSPNMDWWLKSA